MGAYFYRWSWNAFVLTALIVMACGRYPLGATRVLNAPEPEAGDKRLTLAVFGAPWSAEAQSQIPALQTELDKLTDSQQKALDVVLYVPTASMVNDPPTQEIAEQYLRAIGLKGRAIADEWRWKNFKKYVGGSLTLPAAAVIDLDDNPIKAFRSGATSFLPSEILTTVQASFPTRKKVTLALFGAPWCSECKTDMPAIQAELDKLKASQRAFIDTVLYVTTSGNPSVPPTQEGAEQYRETVHIKGRALADEWRWKNFRQWVGGALVLPGAAVLDEQGNVLKAFRAGPTTFIPTEIVDYTVRSIE
jgi:thiol-disulfide isomerase/thioredoxin